MMGALFLILVGVAGMPDQERREISPGIWVGKNFRCKKGAVIGGIPIGKKGFRYFGVEIGDNVEVGPNSVIMEGIEGPTKIGNNVTIGGLCSIGHDCDVGDNVEILIGSHIAGFVTIEKNAVVAMHGSIISRVTIGKGAFVGKDSNVMGDIPNNVIAYGNPARVIRQRRNFVSFLLRHYLK